MSSNNEDKKRLRNERDRERRRNETPQQKKARRANRNEKDALRRVQEVPDSRLTRERSRQREERLARMRARSQSVRERESTHEREERLASNRARSQSIRERETTPEREDRQAEDRARHHERREGETTPEQQISPYDRMLQYHETISSMKSLKCDTCLENFPNLSVSLQPNGVSECSRCANDKRIPKLYSSGNNMDPGVVPTQLQGLTQAEEMLVSAIMPVMSIYRLPHGQYGYSGHVINFPQDVKSFATRLPRLPSEINVLVVRKEREQTHRDFRVRRRVVQEALTWLLANNIYYRSIGVSLDQDALASLHSKK